MRQRPPGLFVSDGDDADAAHDIERRFSVRMDDATISACVTVEDLYEALEAALPDGWGDGQRCASVVTYSRLRRAARSVGAVGRWHPQADLGTSQDVPFGALRRAAAGARLALPSDPPITTALLFLASFVVPLALAKLGVPWWGYMPTVPLLIATARLLPHRPPRGVSMTADLVRRTRDLNFGQLANEGARIDETMRRRVFEDVFRDHARFAVPIDGDVRLIA